MNYSIQAFEKFYDTYSPMLYGMALQLSPTQRQAEELLVKTFVILHKQKFVEANDPCVCINLIRLLLGTAQEQFKAAELHPFKNAPMMNLILSGKMSVREVCLHNRVNVIQLGKIIRAELNSLRTVKKISTPSHQIPEFA